MTSGTFAFMKLAVKTIALLALASSVSVLAACGDDGGSSSGSGGGSSSSAVTTTGANGSTSNVSSGNGSSSSGGDGGGGNGQGGDGGNGQGGGDGGAGQGGSGGAGQGGGGVGGGGDEDIQAACSAFCTSLVEYECVSDVDDCTDGCVAESDIDECRAELITYYECYAANMDNCNTEPEACADEGAAVEACLPDEV